MPVASEYWSARFLSFVADVSARYLQGKRKHRGSDLFTAASYTSPVYGRIPKNMF